MAINCRPIVLLAGDDIIPIGSPVLLIPLAVLVYVPNVDGRAQLTWSVKVVPLQALVTVCIFAIVPIFSIKSVLVARAYTLGKYVGKV